MRTLRQRAVRLAPLRFSWTLRHWDSALEFIMSPSPPPSHQPDTGRWTFSHFTEATTEAQKSAAELGDGIRPSDGGARPESGGAAGTGAQGREWASASSPPPQGTEPRSLQRACQVRGRWATHSEKKHIKEEPKLSPSLLLGWPSLMPQGCIFLCLPNKTGPLFQIFAVER